MGKKGVVNHKIQIWITHDENAILDRLKTSYNLSTRKLMFDALLEKHKDDDALTKKVRNKIEQLILERKLERWVSYAVKHHQYIMKAMEMTKKGIEPETLVEKYLPHARQVLKIEGIKEGVKAMDNFIKWVVTDYDNYHRYVEENWAEKNRISDMIRNFESQTYAQIIKKFKEAK